MTYGLWTPDSSPNYNPPEILRYDPTPGGKRNEDGTTTYSLTFPALCLTEIVANRPEMAAWFAERLNATEGQSKAAFDVLAERRRQVEKEGWSAEHDDGHARGEMAIAGACYALFGSASDGARASTDMPAGLTVSRTAIPGWAAFREIWPWAREWWKPKDRRTDLVRAAALIIAEIERIDRVGEKAAKASGGAA